MKRYLHEHLTFHGLQRLTNFDHKLEKNMYPEKYLPERLRAHSNITSYEGEGGLEKNLFCITKYDWGGGLACTKKYDVAPPPRFTLSKIQV